MAPKLFESFTLTDNVPLQIANPPSGMVWRIGTQASVWLDDDGWYGCLHGIGHGGWAWESDDLGPFKSRLECLEALLDYYKETENE